MNLDFLGDIWDHFIDFIDQFWGGIEDIWGDIGDWWDDLWESGPDCWVPLQNEDDQVSVRSIECFTFYARDCNDNPDENWWNFYDGYDEAVIFINRTNNFWQHYVDQSVDFWKFYNIVKDAGCDPLSEDFEQCLDWNYKNYVNEYFSKLDALLKDNPWAFLEKCLEDSNIPDWSDLAAFRPGEEILQIL